MNVAALIVGLLLLTLGRRLFWVFVGGVGFVVAFVVASDFMHHGGLAALLIATVFGLLGALLAVWMQWVAVGVGGFLAGGHLAVGVVQALDPTSGQLGWLPFLVGGVVGAVLVLALFDPALIVLSSLVGASFVARAVPLDPVLTVIVFAAATVFGIAVQARLLVDRPAGTDGRKPRRRQQQ